MSLLTSHIAWTNNTLVFLDQTRLPGSEIYVTTGSYLRVLDAVKRLEIRGAPLIGVAAGYAAALAALEFLSLPTEEFRSRMDQALNEIEQARPTAVNLAWAVQRIRKVVNEPRDPEFTAIAILDEARRIHEEDRESCRRIGEYGATLFNARDRVLTHCNAGALATGGEGTALNTLFHAWKTERLSEVFACETRPLLQGARLTMWELQRRGIPATLITDSTAAWLMAQGRITAVITGADRIAANGDAANKIGTYSLALAAAAHGIPFYIAAPFSTVDLSLSSGSEIPIEERPAEEVTFLAGIATAPEGTRVYAPAFDVTPAGLIHAIVTDRGILRPDYQTTLLASAQQ